MTECVCVCVRVCGRAPLGSLDQSVGSLSEWLGGRSLLDLWILCLDGLLVVGRATHSRAWRNAALRGTASVWLAASQVHRWPPPGLQTWVDLWRLV